MWRFNRWLRGGEGNVVALEFGLGRGMGGKEELGPAPVICVYRVCTWFVYIHACFPIEMYTL